MREGTEEEIHYTSYNCTCKIHKDCFLYNNKNVKGKSFTQVKLQNKDRGTLWG